MTKSIPDISAAFDTHISRAINVVLKHASNVHKAVIILHLAEQVMRVDGIELDPDELQEEVKDIAEIIDALRQDALDILQNHLDFAEEITHEINRLR